MHKPQNTLARPNRYDYLKVFAIIVMIVDHLGYYRFPQMLELRLIGRFAFPIFLFLVGFNGKMQRRRSLLFSALLVQVVMWLFSRSIGVEPSRVGNILFAVLIARVVLFPFTKVNSDSKEKSDFPLRILGVTTLIFLWLGLCTSQGKLLVLQSMDRVDYGVIGLFFAVAGYLAGEKKDNLSVMWILIYLFSQTLLTGITIERFRFAEAGLESLLLAGNILLWGVLIMMVVTSEGRESRSLQTHTRWDQLLLFFSKHALLIYVVHLLVLMGGYLLMRG